MASFQRTLLASRAQNVNITGPELDEPDRVQFIDSKTSSSKKVIPKRKLKVRILPLLTVLLMVFLIVSAYVLYDMIRHRKTEGNQKKDEANRLHNSRYSFHGCGVRACEDDVSCQARYRRLVSGKEASSHSWPWMTDILIDMKHTCGGVLINRRYILTSAHCLYVNDKPVAVSRLTVVLGSFNRSLYESSRQEHNLCSYIIHDSFSTYTMKNDIALLEMKTYIKFSDFIWPACLPATDTNFDGLGYLIGWGKNKPSAFLSSTLQEVKLPIVNYIQCSQQNNQIYREVKINRDTNLCVGYGSQKPEYACHGDSGGPFLKSINHIWYSIGLVSWIDPTCNSTTRNTYTVLTKLSSFEKWIGDNMDINQDEINS